MSGVSFESPVSSSNTNAAFMAANGDTATVGRVDLNNTLAASGPSIANIQRAINSLSSSLGITNAEVYNFLITWAADYVGAPNDTVKARINALVVKLNGTTGHVHSGVDGDGSLIPSQNVSLVQLKAAIVQGTDIASIAITSTSVDVSSLMGAAANSTGPTEKGWVTNAPYNKIILQDSTGADILHTPSGEVVYGRLTWATSVWTLTFYYSLAGVETAYAFQSTLTNVKWFSQVLVNPITDSGYNYDYMLFTPSTNATADVVDASPTQRGVVSTGTQSFAGDKTFTGNIYALNLSGTNTGDVTISTANGLSILGQALSLALASAGTTGSLSSTDWSTFNGKEPAITTLPASKGGTGSSTYTVGDILYSAVVNTISKLPIGTTGQVLTVVAGFPAWMTSDPEHQSDLLDNQSAYVDISGLTFDAASYIYAKISYSIYRLAGGTSRIETGEISLEYNPNTLLWNIGDRRSSGDALNMTDSLNVTTTSGVAQLQYKTDNMGSSLGKMRWKIAQTIGVYL